MIVHRGTNNWKQLFADVRLALKMVNKQMIKEADYHTSHCLMNSALEEINGEFAIKNGFSVTLTGHSLGGYIAQMCTLLSKFPKFHPIGPRGKIYFANGKSIDMDQSHNIHCVAFDSPGAGAILEQLNRETQEAALRMDCPDDVRHALESLDINVHLSNPNIVNKVGTHFGNVERHDVMSIAKSNTSLGKILDAVNPISSHAMEKILLYFKSK